MRILTQDTKHVIDIFEYYIQENKEYVYCGSTLSVNVVSCDIIAKAKNKVYAIGGYKTLKRAKEVLKEMVFFDNTKSGIYTMPQE